MSSADPARSPEIEARSFHWTECSERIAELDRLERLVLEPKARWFQNSTHRLTPPLVLPEPRSDESASDYRARLPHPEGLLGEHLVLLMQAGAVSLGRFSGGEEIATRTFKRYVVRGKGRAQMTHLATKGKSRYGSRLRLQNAKALLEETNEKLCDWALEFGPYERLFTQVPVRLWPELFTVEPLPPFEKDATRTTIPKDLPRPTTELLLRTYKGLQYGRLESSA